jgi:uncharacterized protein (TIGR03086 family)
MELYPAMAKAAAEATKVVRGVQPDQLELPTPCGDYDVKALINHVIRIATLSNRAARKLPMPTDGSLDRDRDFMTGDWAATFEETVAALVAGWADPAAWEGQTRMGSQLELPPVVAVGMMLSDLVIHGWELARATEQSYHCDDDVARLTYQFVAETAARARAYGVYGDEVEVPASAPVLDRVLGRSGRDPKWAP